MYNNYLPKYPNIFIYFLFRIFFYPETGNYIIAQLSTHTHICSLCILENLAIIMMKINDL